MIQSLRLVLYSQISLGALSILCVAIKPHFLFEANEGGLSNYGLYKTTILPYSLANLLCGSLLLAAANFMPHSKDLETRILKYSLYLIGLEYLILLFSTYTYKVNHTLDLIHIVSAISIFISEIVLGLWLSVGILRTVKDYAYGSLLIISFIGLALTYSGIIHVLFIGEICISATFGLILYDGTAYITKSQT
jgi:hypothetical protein